MANVAPQRQGQMAHRDGHLQAWPPPGRVGAPAMVESRGGRHRKQNSWPHWNRASGGTPEAIPPHPPLVSGGWYHSLVHREVLGPGRYPMEPQVDKSVGVALALSTVFGPAGLCYTSVTAGLIASGAALIALVVFGLVALVAIWPLSIAAAVLSVQLRHRGYERQ